MNSKYLEKKYYPKGYDVMAIQFDGSPDCIDAIKKFCDNRFNDKDLSIKNYDYTVSYIKNGDYIIKYPDNTFGVLSDMIFNIYYKD